MNTQVNTTINNIEWYEGVLREYRLKGAKPPMLIERTDYKVDNPNHAAFLGYQPVARTTTINGVVYAVRVVRSGFYQVFKP